MKIRETLQKQVFLPTIKNGAIGGIWTHLENIFHDYKGAIISGGLQANPQDLRVGVRPPPPHPPHTHPHILSRPSASLFIRCLIGVL